MTANLKLVNNQPAKDIGGTLAPLKNVALFSGLVERVVNRPPHLPGMACFYGHSGFGKTFAAVYASNKNRAYHVEMGDSWTKKTLCDAILHELGQIPHGQVADRVRQIINCLGEDPSRPLIIDEADYLIRRGMIDIAREIHNGSGAPVILIGEELLPTKLEAFERTHNRMLDWVAAVPCDIEDARHLAKLYAPGIALADDLLKRIAAETVGRARRIAVTMETIRESLRRTGGQAIDAAQFTQMGLVIFTGQPPVRRPR